MNLCSTPESAKCNANAVADHAPSARARPGSSSTHWKDVNQTSRSSSERPASRAPASSSSRQEATTSGVMPRPMTTPSAIRPASRNDRERVGAHDDRDRPLARPVEARGGSRVLGLAVAQQAAERVDVRLERRELRGAHAERPDTGASCADPDVGPTRRELVNGRGGGGRDDGVAREGIRDPRPDTDARGRLRDRADGDPRRAVESG